jgi:hypothetical protein
VPRLHRLRAIGEVDPIIRQALSTVSRSHATDILAANECDLEADRLNIMTRLALSEDAGEKFDARGLNTATNKDDEQIVFYRDITKVQVISESDNFAIQVVTKDVVVEMEFADADSIRSALRQFEAKRVVTVDFETPGAVRISPSRSQSE